MPETTQKENPMGYAPMAKLILTTGIPLMLSLLINSLYNFVDSVFVSRVSEDVLTVLSLAAPIQTLVSALGLGNAVISKALGEHCPDKVRKAADGSIFIALCSWGHYCRDVPPAGGAIFQLAVRGQRRYCQVWV